MAGTVDSARLETFLGQVVADRKGLLASVMAILGDRHGLFRVLAATGPCTSADLAAATGRNERYVREWCHCLVAAGYIEYDSSTVTYSLSPEAALILAEETTPMGQSGAYEFLGGVRRELDRVSDAFLQGEG